MILKLNTLDVVIVFIFTVEMATLTRADGLTKTRILSSKEVEALITNYEKREAEAEAAKKEKQKSN